jgi:GntR family transcriptional regulator
LTARTRRISWRNEIGYIGFAMGTLRRLSAADEVAELIARELIHSGLVASGELLPSEQALAARYGTSRATVREGVRTLRDAGLVTVRQGIGAAVLPRSEASGYALDRLSSLEAHARERGLALTVERLAVEEAAADETTARRLALAPGAAVVVVRSRIRLAGAPAALLVDHVPGDVLSARRLRALDGSGLDALLREARPQVDYGDCCVEAAAFPPDVADALGEAPATVGLRIDETVHSAAGRRIARCVGWFRRSPESGGLSVRRRRGIGG